MSDPERRDPEWEQERPLWEAEENDDPQMKESLSLDEFKELVGLNEQTTQTGDE